MKTLLLSLCFLSFSVLAAPEIITEVKVSAFAIDTNGIIRPNPWLWSTNCGLFSVTTNGSLKISDKFVWDFFWSVNSETNLVLKP